MDSASMTATDISQIRLFAQLREQADLSAPDLAALWCVHETTVYRIFNGESVPSLPAMVLLIQKRPKTRTLIFEYLRQGTNHLVYECPDDDTLIREIDPELFGSIRRATDLVERRHRHLADGELDEMEKKEQLDGLDGLISRLLSVRSGIANQPVSRRRQANRFTIHSESTTGHAPGGVA